MVKKKRHIDTVNWENLQHRKYWYPDCDVYEIPKMLPCTHCDVEQWVSFNEAPAVPAYKRQDTGIHFNLYDYQFERVWNMPRKAVELLRQFGAVTNPDFSIYNDFPDALRIYNVYRNRWCGRWWQDQGINVVPLMQWSRIDSFRFCFAGYPKNSICMVSFVGNRMRDESQWLVAGFNKFVEEFTPTRIIVYGKAFPFVIESGIPYEEIPTYADRLNILHAKQKREKMAKMEHFEQLSMLPKFEDSGIGNELMVRHVEE